MITSTTKRRFTDEFKREAATLWETSGRLQIELAAELRVMPTIPRRPSAVTWSPTNVYSYMTIGP
jgi:hypothetical protein